ncbi:C6 zinc finger domain protein [Aspergillus steynii IBT 23096]|uniref:C6 zinc finger domain protein n=1 Tax=Aspergillus steynii IBT 23096 TaxID=1392250 RepID=A0A2I2G1X7_9EURO|nr:C6 zinc finger domain protein [Aspergillus steynii IBT 23096]PLB46869.1 C6 zinc finger domain protein [Aspergillus steynii IBT 23096]
MDSDDSGVVAAPPGKKRIPKSCTNCRQSKVKCDGKRPCTRCDKIKKKCVFFETPKDPTTQRLETVENEVQRLNEQLEELRGLLHSQISQSCHESLRTPSPPRIAPTSASITAFDTMASPEAIPHSRQYSAAGEVHLQSPLQAANSETSRPSKRRRSGFEIRDEPVSDFISKGLITADYAVSCFNTYIPIFDPGYDTFTSVRSRSSILLNAICTIGSRVERSGSQMSDLLHSELKRWINVIIQNEKMSCLESVQALLVVACYSAERSLLLSFATRMALDLGIDAAFEELTHRLTMKEVEEISNISGLREEERILMVKSRTWFGLLVLEHIFRVDGGKPPGIRMTGNARRCRMLLRHPSSTVLDLRLFSQVELTLDTVNINDTLGASQTLNRTDIADFVHEAKVDLDLWFDDWLRIIENTTTAAQEKPYLLAALRVQKCWSEMMLHCKALRSMGVENNNPNHRTMSSVERNILLMAKASARKHLRLISVEPDFYLAKLKYAMDFVWAKCAFCFLLLLKLSRLLPERKEEHQELLDHGTRLLDELAKSGSNSDTTGNGNVYLHILRLSIEKYGRTLQENEMGLSQTATTAPFWELFDAQADLQSFVPEQFVTEWDFPGLNLFYFPTAWQDFFGDFSLAV